MIKCYSCYSTEHQAQQVLPQNVTFSLSHHQKRLILGLTFSTLTAITPSVFAETSDAEAATTQNVSSAASNTIALPLLEIEGEAESGSIMPAYPGGQVATGGARRSVGRQRFHRNAIQ